MRSVFFLVVLTLSTTAKSQTPYKVYYDQENKRVNKENAFYYEVGTKVKKRKIGNIKQYYLHSDALKNSSQYDNNGILNGLSEEFYPDGSPKFRVMYENGTMVTYPKFWTSTGHSEEREYIVSKIDFEFQKEIPYLIINSWDSKGNQQVVNGDGYYYSETKEQCHVIFDELNKIRHHSIEGQVVKGTRHGTWQGTTPDGFKFQEKYKKGQLISGRTTGANGKNNSYTLFFTDPQPKIGMAGFYNYITRSINYPDQARRTRKQGKVFVKFLVDENGNVIDVETVKGFDNSCNEEAERVIKTSRNWIPALERGISVKGEMVLPVTFKLS